MSKILTVQNIHKRFRGVHAVNDISFEMEEGEIFAFLGPNGAGKTTTLRILLDIIKAEAGEIRWNINGHSSSLADPTLIGYLPEERGLYPDLPVLRTLVYMASIRGMKPSEAKKAAMEWLERLGLEKRINEKLQTLSKGNQQKVQFISSILHKPLFAILDEPFSGFDPVNQEMFAGFIKEINQQGTTILLSAHQMQLVEKIAGKLFLINDGKEIFYGNVADILSASDVKHTFEISFQNEAPVELMRQIQGVDHALKQDERKVMVTFDEGLTVKDITGILSGLDGMTQLKSHNANLHDIFLNMVNKKEQ